MQFSTSTALAALAIFAGQTLAICDFGYPEEGPGGGAAFLPCTSLGSGSWLCGSSKSVITLGRDKKTWTLKGGSEGRAQTYVEIICGPETKVAWCTPGDQMQFEYSCRRAYKVNEAVLIA
ncbi:hypothetical protein E4U53_002173 [Claviceps sorghi]|nr:hypothetical protein E4U53_002173 [Claviceps sorghi]